MKKYGKYVIGAALLILLAGLIYYFTRERDEPILTGPSPGPSPGGQSQLTITENGTTLTEGYRMMPRREAYIQMPRISNCGTSSAADYCSAYVPTDTNGFAYVYDLSLADARTATYTECPGGGHDCWFTEKYDSKGTMIGVVNKNGESMLDKLIDDIWDDKLSMNSPMAVGLLRQLEFKNGKLITTMEFNLSGTGGSNTPLAVGDEFKITDIPMSGIYFVVLFLAMKKSGEEKPGTVVVNVKNAKEKFDTFRGLAEDLTPTEG